jgi:hypothetical protein
MRMIIKIMLIFMMTAGAVFSGTAYSGQGLCLRVPIGVSDVRIISAGNMRNAYYLCEQKEYNKAYSLIIRSLLEEGKKPDIDKAIEVLEILAGRNYEEGGYKREAAKKLLSLMKRHKESAGRIDISKKSSKIMVEVLQQRLGVEGWVRQYRSPYGLKDIEKDLLLHWDEAVRMDYLRGVLPSKEWDSLAKGKVGEDIAITDKIALDLIVFDFKEAEEKFISERFFNGASISRDEAAYFRIALWIACNSDYKFSALEDETLDKRLKYTMEELKNGEKIFSGNSSFVNLEMGIAASNNSGSVCSIPEEIRKLITETMEIKYAADKSANPFTWKKLNLSFIGGLKKIVLRMI